MARRADAAAQSAWRSGCTCFTSCQTQASRGPQNDRMISQGFAAVAQHERLGRVADEDLDLEHGIVGACE